MDKKFCDNCAQEIWNKEWLELSTEGKSFYSRDKVTTCSYKCMEEWIDIKRRHVVENKTNSTKTGSVNLGDNYYNVEIGKVDISDCTQVQRAFGDPCLVVKSEVFRERLKK